MNEEVKDLEELIYEEKNETMDEGQEDNAAKAAPIPQEEKEPEIIPSMDEFESEINNSFKKIKEGDILKGTVIGVTETEVTLDLNYYTEGIIKLEELSSDPRFSIKTDIVLGEEVFAMVIGEDREGGIILSRKQADDVLAWESLKELMAGRTICNVKIAQAVKGGVVTYLKGIRAFMPASQLGLEYVEDLESYVGKELEAIVITVDEEKKKLVLSSKEPARDKALEDKNSRISNLQKGLVTTGVVEKIMPFGAFVNIGQDLSGLVHVSRICGKRIKSPNEVIKEGETVKVKIIDIKDGKISLSMKDADEKEVIDDVAAALSSYSYGSDATTGLGALLKGIKL